MADAISVTPMQRVEVKMAPAKHPHMTVMEPPSEIGARRLPAAPTHELRMEKATTRVATVLNCFFIRTADCSTRSVRW